MANIVGSFKSAVTKRINEIQKSGRVTIWQRGYYDHIVRTEKSLHRIREYIRTNPERWKWDIEDPKGESTDEFYRWLKEEAKHSIPRTEKK